MVVVSHAGADPLNRLRLVSLVPCGLVVGGEASGEAECTVSATHREDIIQR